MADNLYPLQFEPYFKEFVWGSRKLETSLRKHLPAGKLIGESWEIFDTNKIRNGPLAGLTLIEIVHHFGKALLGNRATQYDKFPLLVKLSATELDLSLQVHPDDVQARKIGADSSLFGKTEMIYVLEAKPNAKVFLGLRDKIDRDVLEAHLARGKAVLEVVEQRAVKPGDVIFVPPGTVHAYGAGLVYFELQQNSDVTYRLYDWDRLDSAGQPRHLHIELALETVDFEAVEVPKITPVCLMEHYGQRCFLVACNQFLVDRLSISSKFVGENPGDSFHLLCVINGSAQLHTHSLTEPVLGLEPGDVVLLPASIAEYELVPCTTCQVLRSFVPELQRDVINYLLERAISTQSILALGGGIPSKNDIAPLLR